mmetsp:Transcript_19981/g.33727  ORF Transcript_19981/g.33727 Transcript_19981/m.33727 type:complete len:247 (-) Transcript_19981:126-866(-)
MMRLVILLALANLAASFSSSRCYHSVRPISGRPRSLIQCNLVPLKSVEEATRNFWVFFICGNGGLTIGLAQFPVLAGRLKDGLSRAGQDSRGGPTLEVPHALLLYPEPLSIFDLDAVIGAPALIDLEELIAAGPQETYLQQRGYLTFAAFEQALSRGPGGGFNPLAVRAVFDALFKTQDAVEPTVAIEALAKWKSEGSTGTEGASFTRDLVGAKAGSYVPIATFVFLLWLIADIIFENAQMAFFSS